MIYFEFIRVKQTRLVRPTIDLFLGWVIALAGFYNHA